MTTPGTILRFARKRAGLTQRELAERAGTKQAAVSRVERDAVSPTVATLARLVEACDGELILTTRRRRSWDDDA